MLIPLIAIGQDAARDKLVVETLIRLKRFNISNSEELRGSVLRHMDTLSGTEKFVELAEKFKLRESTPELIKLAQRFPTETLGVNAINAVLHISGSKVIKQGLNTEITMDAVALIQALGNSTSPTAPAFLIELYRSSPRNRQIYTATALAIANTIPGQRFLIAEAKAGRLRPEITFAVGNALYASPDKGIQASARATIKLPVSYTHLTLPTKA